MRLPLVDSMYVARRRSPIHALVEVDVTAARRALQAHKLGTGESLSFTAFVITCLARTLTEHPMAQAYRLGRRRLILFHDVDVCTLVEHDVGDVQVATPHVIRAANRRSLRAIHEEIRGAQKAGADYAWAEPLYASIPAPVRRTLWRALGRAPRLHKRIAGTVVVTAVGMFGQGSGWGIPITDYTLALTIGGIAEKPGMVAGRIEVREYLSLTVSADHDVVDGAPLARFVERLKELIECGYGLEDAGVSVWVAVPRPRPRRGTQ
jgi:pyruvate/2-oxoglutarate dehydrogenase complex dihydrolipoamide acyltransferase (E2) component